MGFIAESKRRHFWFGTEQLMQWMPTPNRGAQTGSEGWTAEGQLLNGGSSQLGSFGSHREYVFEWPSTSTAKASQTLKSYADGSFGRGLIYFLDPLIYTTNIFPAMWADPSMGIGQEGATLVYGVDPTALPTSGREQNELPVNSAYYDLTSVSAGWRGKEDAIFLPVPEGYTLSLGAIYSSTGSGGVFYRTQTKTGALGAVTSLTALTPSTSTLVNTFIGAPDLAGVWVYVGKSSAGASSVTATAMTARLLPSVSAVVTPVATNYAPSLYGPTVPVEVRRNLIRTPLISASFSNWGFPGGDATSSIVTGGRRVTLGAGWTHADAYALWSTGSTVAAGDVVSLAVRVRNDSSVARSVRMGTMWRNSAGSAISAVDTDAVMVPPGGEHTFVMNGAVAPAGTAEVRIGIRLAGWVTGDAFTVFDGASVEIAPVSSGLFAPGLQSPDADLSDGGWLGAANASESVLEGQHPTAFTDSNCVSIIHEVGDGTLELRLIPTSANNDSFTRMSSWPSVLTGAINTAIGTVRIQAPLTGSLHARRLGVYQAAAGNAATVAQNLAGTTALRNISTVKGLELRMYHGGTRGSGDVYWSKIGLFEGDYGGPWFDGNSGVFSIGSQLVRAKWDGAPGGSTSTAYTTSPELEAIGTGPWIGGQGHSGCRFVRKPTETKNGPFNGGQVGFAASFTEVGSWLYG